MNINEAFPSKYISASDLKGQEVAVTISNVVMEEVQGYNGKETVPVVYFQGKQKGLILNKTNAGVIQDAFGPETTAWYGRQLMLYSVHTQKPSGEPTEGTRVRAITAVAATPPAQMAQQAPVQQPQADPFAMDNQPIEAQPSVGEEPIDKIPF